MAIDWDVVVKVTGPIAGAIGGNFLRGRIEKRPHLISYYGHTAAFRHTMADGQTLHVHTHSVVLRNTGRAAATEIRLHHNNLPAFMLWPNVVHHVENLEGGGHDIVIPKLIPGEQVMISYLYFPPMTYNQINNGIKCDQGFANAIPVLLQRQYPLSLVRIRAALVGVGLVTVVYWLYRLLAALLP